MSINEMSDKEKLAQILLESKDKLRFRCMVDLYFLATKVLGYAEGGGGFSARLHKPLCDVVQSVNVKVAEIAGKECTLNESVYGREFLSKVRAIRNPMSELSRVNLVGGDVMLREELHHGYYEFSKYVTFNENSLERLFLLFRGGFKTTIISICHTIQLMLLWPNIRILITSHKKEGGSLEILKAVKHHFMASEMLKALFPEFISAENSKGVIEWGTQERVTLPNRSLFKSYPEATVEIAGLTTDVTGRHYDYIKNDDLVTRESTNNESMIQKVRDFKALQKFLFNQPEWGITDNVGTIYHFLDLHNQMKKSSRCTKVVVPAVDDRGDPVFHERFSRKGLEDIKNDSTMSSYEWSCQYQLDPVPPEDQTFREAWLDRLGFYYDASEIRDVPMSISVYVDPASRRRKESDYTAICVIGVAPDKKKYLLYIARDKLAPEQRTNLVLDIAEKFHTKSIYYETIGFQDTDKYIVEKKALERKCFVSVSEVKASRMSKEDRIRGLQPLYERGDIRWPKKLEYYSQYERKTLNMIELLRDEMLMFPKCEHDDMLDCHSFMLKSAEYAPSVSKPAEEVDLIEQIRRNHIQSHTANAKKVNNLTPFTNSVKKKIEIPYKQAYN